MSTATPAARVARTYDRIAAVYDLLETPMDWFGGRRRRCRVLANAYGCVLEVGIGTGRNLALYPPGVRPTGIDISPKMLQRAQRQARRLRLDIPLEVADVEALPFGDATFDCVTATCVFCSVPDPIRGLREVARVCKPAGQVLLVEHVRPRIETLGRIFDWVSPLTKRLIGPEINRRTEDNVASAGLVIIDIRRHGIWREIRAQPGSRPAGAAEDQGNAASMASGSMP